VDEKQETLAECLDRIAAHTARDRQTRMVNERSDIGKRLIQDEPQRLSSNNFSLLALVEFLQNCAVLIGKTKVLRVRGSHARAAFQHKNRYVMPNVVLVWKDRKLPIYSLPDLYDWADVHDYSTRRVVRRTVLPGICQSWGNINIERNSIHTNPGLYDPFMDELVAAFLYSAGDNWKKVCQEVQAEWDRVKTNLDAHVTAQFDAKGTKERKEFQDKLAKMLGITKGLIDATPEAILEIFKLGYKDIEQLARFSARNKADTALVQLEDIVDAQNEIRVRKVMES